VNVAGPEFSVAHGDDLHQYLITRWPSAEDWRLVVHSLAGRSFIPDVERGWVSPYRKLAADEYAWPIGNRAFDSVRSIHAESVRTGELLYRLLLDEDGMVLYGPGGSIVREEGHAQEFGCDYCRAGASDWLARRSWGPNIATRPHHEFRISSCPVCAQDFLEEEVEFVDWSGAWGGDDAWYRWRPLNDRLREQVHRVVDAQNDERRKLSLLGQIMVGGRRLLMNPIGNCEWVRGPMDGCDLMPPG
jgi:hypothetical protein